MSLWDNIKQGARSIWSGVKNIFSSGDTYTDTVANDKTNDSGKQTLNEQIASGNINNTTNNTSQTTIPNSGFDILKEKLNEPSTPIDTNTIQQSTSKVIDDKEDEGFLSKLKNFGNKVVDTALKVDNWVNTKAQNRERNRLVGDEYDRREERMAVGYDPNNKNVYYLDLNEDRGLFDWDVGTNIGTYDRFRELYNEALYEISTTGDYNKAWGDFYDKAKGLFRIRSDDYYGSPFRSGIKRRSQMYSDDELNMLSKTGKTEKGKYEPTQEEFMDYVSMFENNEALKQELQIISDEHNPDSEQIKIDAGAQSDWMSENRDIALKNIDSMLEPMSIVNPNAATKARLTYSSYILNDKLGRRYAQVAPIYKAEQEILSRDKSTWSGYDIHLLEQADKARQMDKQFASNVNELFRQILLYGTDKNGEIINTPDMFENGESLNDILTKGLREIAGEDSKWYRQHQSDLDIVQNFANEAMYMYNQDKVKGLRRFWNNVEYFIEPVGSTLGEAGQAIAGTTLSVLGAELDSQYMDQDATAFRLLETDDSNTKRTIKKYYLQGLEYIPEVAGNLIPDIILYILTGPGAVATTLRHIDDLKTASRVVKAAKGASFLNKLRYINRLGRGVDAVGELGLSANKYREIIEASKNIANTGKYYQRIKTGAQLLDRTVTELGLGQFMDAQWSAYDTEPYSQASFLMSVIGSGMFDMLPHLTTLATGRKRWNLLSGDSIWSLARYIDSSPEAISNIAKMLQKGTKEIGIEELQAFVKDFGTIEEAARQAYNGLTPLEKNKIGELTKELTYNYINQAFGANSTIGKNVRQMLSNKNSNLADVVKYVARIPGDVSVGPYVSTIRLKNGTRANIYAIDATNGYSPVLDSVFDGGFSSRIDNGFSQADLDKLSKVDGYSNIEKNKSKWFYSVTTDGKGTTYYLNKDGLKHFGLKPESVTLESLGVTLKEAEDTRAALKQIKGAKGVNISDKVIDDLADTGAYDEITSKVKEVLGC